MITANECWPPNMDTLDWFDFKLRIYLYRESKQGQKGYFIADFDIAEIAVVTEDLYVQTYLRLMELETEFETDETGELVKTAMKPLYTTLFNNKKSKNDA